MHRGGFHLLSQRESIGVKEDLPEAEGVSSPKAELEGFQALRVSVSVHTLDSRRAAVPFFIGAHARRWT